MTYNPAAIGFALVALPICYTLALAALPVGMEIPHFPQFALTSLPRSADRVLLMPRRRKGEGGEVEPNRHSLHVYTQYDI